MLPMPKCPYMLWLQSMTTPSHSQIDWIVRCSEWTWTRGECVWHASVFVRIEAAASETTREKSSVVYHATSSFHPFQINIACHPGGHFIGSLANQCRWPVPITCFLLYCSINPYQSSNIIPKKRGAKDLLDWQWLIRSTHITWQEADNTWTANKSTQKSGQKGYFRLYFVNGFYQRSTSLSTNTEKTPDPRTALDPSLGRGK